MPENKMQIMSVDDQVLYENDAYDIRDLVYQAVRKSVTLRHADLRGADLNGAFLAGAKLSGADLSGADLSGADLSRAEFGSASLVGARLEGARLDGAVLDDGVDITNTILDNYYCLVDEVVGSALPSPCPTWTYEMVGDPREVCVRLEAFVMGGLDGAPMTDTTFFIQGDVWCYTGIFGIRNHKCGLFVHNDPATVKSVGENIIMR
jgi:hypothetical protein